MNNLFKESNNLIHSFKDDQGIDQFYPTWHSDNNQSFLLNDWYNPASWWNNDAEGVYNNQQLPAVEVSYDRGSGKTEISPDNKFILEEKLRNGFNLLSNNEEAKHWRSYIDGLPRHEADNFYRQGVKNLPHTITKGLISDKIQPVFNHETFNNLPTHLQRESMNQDIRNTTGFVAKNYLLPATAAITTTAAAPNLVNVTPRVLDIMANPFSNAVKLIPKVNSLSNVNKYTKLADAGVNAYEEIDGIYNFFTGNGVQKTFNHLKNREYSDAFFSGLGDLMDVSGPYGKFTKKNVIEKFNKDLQFSNNYGLDLNSNMNKQEKIYNSLRPYLKSLAYGTGINDVLSPIAYKLMVVNEGKSNPLNIWGRSWIESLPKGDRMHYKENLKKLYREQMFSDTIWKDVLPSGLTPNESKEARLALQQLTGSRYHNLPIYNMDVEPRKNLNPNMRGNYNINGSNWRSIPIGQSRYLKIWDDVAGHWEKTVKTGPSQFTSEIFDVQHYTPWGNGYNAKWSQNDQNKFFLSMKDVLLSAIDIIGNDFALYNKLNYTVKNGNNKFILPNYTDKINR